MARGESRGVLEDRRRVGHDNVNDTWDDAQVKSRMKTPRQDHVPVLTMLQRGVGIGIRRSGIDRVLPV